MLADLPAIVLTGAAVGLVWSVTERIIILVKLWRLAEYAGMDTLEFQQRSAGPDWTNLMQALCDKLGEKGILLAHATEREVQLLVRQSELDPDIGTAIRISLAVFKDRVGELQGTLASLA